MKAESPHVKYCQGCGSAQYYSTRSEMNRATKKNTICHACHNKSGRTTKGKYKDIPISWFEEKRRRAVQREKEFEIDIKYIWGVYLRQNRKCALSGLPLDFSKDTEIGVVSLDRIKNDKGYVKRNIQLVHKDINFMKYVYDQKYFINMCKLVAENNK